MQFKKETLAEIAAKRVNLAFRRWKQAERQGRRRDLHLDRRIDGRLVRKRPRSRRISAADLKRAGYPSRSALFEGARAPSGRRLPDRPAAEAG